MAEEYDNYENKNSFDFNPEEVKNENFNKNKISQKKEI